MLIINSNIKIGFQVLLAICLIPISYAYASERTVTIHSISKPPVIDGKLNDDVWQKGVWLTNLGLLGRPGQLAKVQTEFQIAHDDNYLYLAAKMHEPNPGQLEIKEFRRDGSGSRDDCF